MMSNFKERLLDFSKVNDYTFLYMKIKIIKNMEKTKVLKLAEKIFSLAEEREEEIEKFKNRVKYLAENKANQVFIEAKTAKQKEIEYELRRHCLKLLAELY